MSPSAAEPSTGPFAAPSWLHGYGRPLGVEEVPAVLLRFPGACGVRDFLHGTLSTLARSGDRVTWFTRATFEDIERGVGHFGCFLVFDPLRYGLCEVAGAPGIYVGTNPRVVCDADVTWMPPRLMASIADWSPYATVESAHALVGPTLKAERTQMAERVNAYFEEISALLASGRPPPDRPWYDVSPAERAGILSEIGHAARWTGKLERPASPTSVAPR